MHLFCHPATNWFGFDKRGERTATADRITKVGMCASDPVIPTVFSKEPFGEDVEGLSYFRLRRF
jgi:hypothetical protein